MSIASEITRLQNAKASIKTSIENKGVTVGDGTLDTYASKIDAIETGITPTGTINITENGTYDVTDKASANVNVPSGLGEYLNESYKPGSYPNYWLPNILKKVPVFSMEGITSMNKQFYGCINITTIPQLDTSKVTDMSYMFGICKNIKTIPLLDTSKVTNMSYMFWSCSKLTTISQLDTSNVTNMSSMFDSCSSLITIPLLDTSNVTNMSSMFRDCSKLTTIPQLNTSKVTNMYMLFRYCESLENVPLLNAQSVTNIEQIFYHISKLTTFGGLQNLGQNYNTNTSANYSGYELDLRYGNKLTHDSLMNVINNLYDIATKGCKVQQLLMGSTNMAKLTAEEIAIATNKGWSVS